LEISRELISRKLAGQELVARDKLLDSRTAETISQFRTALPDAETIDAIRLLESQAAAAYWSAWRDLPIAFPKKDLPVFLSTGAPSAPASRRYLDRLAWLPIRPTQS